MRFRPDTWDSFIADAVLIRNEYGLPSRMDGQVVVDVGAHIGSFTVACMKRNAKAVFCFEPDQQNAQLLKLNVEDVEPESVTDVTIYEAAVTGMPQDNLGVRRLSEHDFGRGRNTGHVDVFGPSGSVTGICINDIFEKIVGERIDLLKIDCEGAEWGIFDYGDFSNVSSICAELHAVPDVDHPLVTSYKGKTLTQLADAVQARLTDFGFDVAVTYDSAVTAKLNAGRRARVTQKKPRLLWIGDACTPTGYGRVTEQICTRLAHSGWDVRVLGIGYNGDPHSLPFKIYPAVDPNTGGARNGASRIKAVVDVLHPDIAVIQDDSWNVGAMLDSMAMQNVLIPTVGYVAIDSENVREDVIAQLRNLKHAICHTQFGINQLRQVGYTGAVSISPHGVDTSIYRPYDRQDARSGIPFFGKNSNDAFICGVVAMNQPRKRLDLTVAYWAAWWRAAGKPENAYLYIHTNLDGVWDLRQLATYCGIRGRMFHTDGVLKDIEMPSLYNAFDVMLSTSEGESFGIPLLEGMACGIPQIAVSCGGAPSWAGDAVYWVKPSFYQFTANRTNTKRYIASESDFVEAINTMYGHTEIRNDYARRGLELASKLSWDDAARHFDTTLRQVLTVRQAVSKANKNAFADF